MASGPSTRRKAGKQTSALTASWFLKSSGKIRYMESKAVLAKGSEEVKTKSRDAFYNSLSEQKKKKIEGEGSWHRKKTVRCKEQRRSVGDTQKLISSSKITKLLRKQTKNIAWTAEVQERIQLLGENPFNNFPASKRGVPARSSQSLFGGKASPKGAGVVGARSRVESASFGRHPLFFSFIPRLPVGTQLLLKSQGVISRSLPLGRILTTEFIKSMLVSGCLPPSQESPNAELGFWEWVSTDFCPGYFSQRIFYSKTFMSKLVEFLVREHFIGKYGGTGVLTRALMKLYLLVKWTLIDY